MWDRPDTTWSPATIGKKQKTTSKMTPEAFFGEERMQELRVVSVPEDLRRIVGAPDQLFLVDRHVLKETAPGGKHDNARWHVEHLEEVIDHWRLWANSPPEKVQEDAARWEIYTRLNYEYWILAILGTDGRNRPYRIVSMYPVKRQTVKNRLEGNAMSGTTAYLQPRGGW